MLRSYDFAANIHMYKWKDLSILLDVNTGAVHLLDDITYDLVNEIIAQEGNTQTAVSNLSTTYPRAEMEEILGEFRDLIKADAMFTQDETPDIRFPDLKVKAICLNVAHACNMACHYCFASQGDFGMKPCLMDLDTAKRTMDFLIEKSGDIRNLEVDFFGGEPLLVKDMLRELVVYCREREKECNKRFNFTLTTNCVLLDDKMIDWVIENDIAMIMSIDGRPETHDRHRVMKNGEGSYDRVLPPIKKMVARQPV
ncbi:MAG: radical SAM protein, partial [Bacillota bacterium]|nr:radical SAM protein [Bacillota bacterium]